MTFNSYYRDIYLPAHSKRSTKLLHMAGVLATFLWIAAALNQTMTVGLLMLLMSPFVVYPFAWASHAIFEKNKPLAFTNPLWAKASDLRMCAEILTGKLSL